VAHVPGALKGCQLSSYLLLPLLLLVMPLPQLLQVTACKVQVTPDCMLLQASCLLFDGR
jgi:hypothetical protein